jgi:serpin B
MTRKIFVALAKHLLTSAISVGLFSLVSCNNNVAQNPATNSEEMIQPSDVASNSAEMSDRVTEAYTEFAFKLFSQLSERQEQQNIFISPASITTALSMTYNGAYGETQDAIAQVLAVQGISVEELNQSNAALKAALENADEEVKLTLANSLWLNKEASFLPAFLQGINESYDAKLTQLDFSQPEAVDEINTWVQQQTNDKINAILDEIPPQAILYLINAIYFKGSWSEPFAPEATEEQPFTLLDGSTKPHPLMSQTGEYRYLETDQMQAVSIPYGDGRLSLYVFLPNTESNLVNFYQNLSQEQWEDWMSRFQFRPGTVKLPRFQLEYETSLNEVLKQMGMEVAFDPGKADFSQMTLMENAHISQVKHKTFVEVNEEGTEAAAVTSVGVVATSAPVDPPFSFVADRPFFCAIRDNQTGTILFMGSIVDPS